MNPFSALLASVMALLGTQAPPVGEDIQAAGPKGALRGSFVAGGAAAPVMLILPGSGPTDRDGNSPAGVAAAPYRLLAQALAERGISTVRIDKRGAFGSAAAGDANNVTIADYVTDTRAWVRALRERTGGRCVWLLGHSEGGLVALAAAQEASDICGLVLVAAPGRRLGETMREQLRANPANAPLLEPAMAAIDRLERGERVDVAGLHPALAQLFTPAIQGYWISLFSYDPAELAARVQLPMLVMQGQRDIQVAEADARRLAGANPAAKLVLLPDVNHVLKAVPTDDRAANLAAYADPALPLAEGVADAIAEFLKRRGQPKR